jgi:hypothetical protein
VAEIDDLKAFGDFLSKAKHKIGKSTVQLEAEMGLRNSVAWQRYQAFPLPDKLPDIARAYEVDIDELKAAYDKAKAGRQEERRCRRNPPPGRQVNLRAAANYDMPSFGPAAGRTHYFKKRS